MTTTEIVQKLWNLCNVLRDDGITYHQYVTELTYILFLKMAKETGAEKKIPKSYFDLTKEKVDFQERQAFTGIELVPDTHRLTLMNAMLHGIEGQILQADALSNNGKQFRDYDVILTNPPFGTKRGGERPTRDDLTYPTSNKQLNFLQTIYRALKNNGKARDAVVLPDNVLFADGDGQKIRADLMNKYDLHTILRLPTGIFYAQGVKTNVLFFTRGKTDKGNTKKVWVYDMRTNMPSFGKRNPLTIDHFTEFIAAYGKSPYGRSRRKDQGETGRFRCFTREQIAKRNDSLDISWLQDDSVRNGDDLGEPADIAEEILAQLDLATKEMQELTKLLGEAS
ncbi:hypothetical protein DSCO28_29880 [Desulfosarcina ovata subsp. sediminis]|uniref:site-specific DNA-methyltransferase (adenine-specific) n=1 Tax=Desulfosarcina ovata subsp. sediminis TaxID=885957 RepID=A0A5K7ZJT6_9BACT|nr:N-6 DNA methylase [Desulfosarcina ovata]BBO82422.1 hypothetical protein DSCO28_29880 [Desulfosarcina ovata subsp. sediminis]